MNDSISEKEFLKSFIEFAEVCDYDLDDNLIQTWLDYHHTEFYEVEFVRKPKEDIKGTGITFVDCDTIPEGEAHLVVEGKVVGKLVGIRALE